MYKDSKVGMIPSRFLFCPNPLPYLVGIIYRSSFYTVNRWLLFLRASISKMTFPAILGLGLGLRIMYAILLGDTLLAGDGVYYVQTAEKIVEGESFKATWPPGLPHILAGWIMIWGKSLVSIVSLMLAIHMCFATLLFHLLQQWSTQIAARLVSFIFAVSPTFIHHAVAPLTHLPVALCVLCMVYGVWQFQGTRWHLAATGVGLALGAAMLIRPGSLLLAPVIIYWGYRHIPGNWGTKVVRLSIPLILASGMVLAWETRAYHLYDRFIWINETNSSNLYIGNNPDTPHYKTWWLGSHDEADNPEFQQFYRTRDYIYSLPRNEQSPTFTREALHYVWDAPGTFLYRTINRVRVFFAFDTFTGAVFLERFPEQAVSGKLLLAADGFLYLLIGTLAIISLTDSGRPTQFIRFLCWVILVYATPYFLAFSHPTYHLPVVPLLAIIAAIGWAHRSIRIGPLPLSTRLAIAVFWLIQAEWVWHMKSSIGL